MSSERLPTALAKRHRASADAFARRPGRLYVGRSRVCRLDRPHARRDPPARATGRRRAGARSRAVRWWFQTTFASGTVGTELVFYAGVAALVIAWLGLGFQLRRADALGMRTLVVIGALWSLPLALGPPLFSRDVYSYIAQGTLLHLGHNPYQVTPLTLGHLGQRHILNAVSHTWLKTTAPYGPLFLLIVGWLMAAAGYKLVLGVILVRLLAILGVALFGRGASAPGAKGRGRPAAGCLAHRALTPGPVPTRLSWPQRHPDGGHDGGRRSRGAALAAARHCHLRACGDDQGPRCRGRSVHRRGLGVAYRGQLEPSAGPGAVGDRLRRGARGHQRRDRRRRELDLRRPLLDAWQGPPCDHPCDQPRLHDGDAAA